MMASIGPTIWKRPWCWLRKHRWGEVVRTMHSHDQLPTRQRYCDRCGKAAWFGCPHHAAGASYFADDECWRCNVCGAYLGDED